MANIRHVPILLFLPLAVPSSDLRRPHLCHIRVPLLSPLSFDPPLMSLGHSLFSLHLSLLERSLDLSYDILLLVRPQNSWHARVCGTLPFPFLSLPLSVPPHFCPSSSDTNIFTHSQRSDCTRASHASTQSASSFSHNKIKQQPQCGGENIDPQTGLSARHGINKVGKSSFPGMQFGPLRRYVATGEPTDYDREAETAAEPLHEAASEHTDKTKLRQRQTITRCEL